MFYSVMFLVIALVSSVITLTAMFTTQNTTLVLVSFFVAITFDVLSIAAELSRKKRQLKDFLKSTGFVIKANTQNATGLKFFSGLNTDDQYFVFIENSQVLSIRESDTTPTKLNQQYTVYLWNGMCVVKNSFDNSLQLYRR